jgi:single-strand DNA-binding protein
MSIENRVTLIGFTGKDAETASTQAGKQIARLSIATNKRYKDAQDQWKEKTSWHRCVAYGTTADYVGKIQKGAQVLIEGELSYREYERTIETPDGPVKVQWPLTEILIDSVKVLDRQAKREERGAA